MKGTNERSRLRQLSLVIAAAMTISLLRDVGLAQEVDPRSTATAHVGPLYITPKLVLKDFGMDSNVFNAGTDPKSDFTFTLTPVIDVAAGVRRARLTVQSSTDLVYFATQNTERSVNQDIGAAGRLSFRRFTAFAEASYLNTRRRVGAEIDARSRRVEFASDAGIRARIASKLSGQLSVRQSAVEFDPNAIFDHVSLSERLNRNARGVAASVRYAVTPLTTVVTSTDVTETRFRLSPIRDADSWRTLFGVDLNRRALVSGAVHLGFQRVRSVTGALPDYTGPIGSVDVSYRLLGSASLGLSLDRDLRYSYTFQEPYYISEGFGVSVRRPLSQRFDLVVAAGRFWHRYSRLGSSTIDTTTRRRDALGSESVAISYRSTTRTQFTVGLSSMRRHSDEREYLDYDGLHLLTNIAYTF